MFADDTLIYVISDNIHDACNKLNQDFSALFNNLCQYKLKLIVSKTKGMIITNKKNADPNNFKIEINNEIIELVTEMKYLGVVIDCKLNFEANINYICKKIGKKLNVLARSRNQLNCQQKIAIYKIIIEPHYTYCSSILFLSKQSDINRLQIIQNKCMRTILRLNRYSHERDILKILNFFSVQQLINFNTLTLIFKITKELTPQYLSERLNYNKTNARKNTLRDRNKIELTNATKTCSQNSLFYKGVALFNRLPDSIKSSNTIPEFKKKLKVVIMEII